MREIKFRAKHSYSDKYIISNSIKWELDMLYLLDRGTWTECEPTTRSVSYSNMVDKNNIPIFASLSEDGIGGDIIKYINPFDVIHIRTLQFTNLKLLMINDSSRTQIFKVDKLNKEEVIGIHKGIK